MNANKQLILVGSETNDTHDVGIRALEFSPTTATLRILNETKNVKNPSYMAKHPQLAIVYAVQECAEDDGAAVLAYSYDETGQLTLLNQKAVGSDGPCYVAVEGSGRYLAVANYGGGSVSFHALTPSGEVVAQSQLVKHTGNADAHAHSAVFGSSGKKLYVTDLGLDKVFMYQTKDRLEPADPPFVALHAGAGPRHLVLHPKGFAFVVNELDSSLSSFRLNGSLDLIETVSTLPPNTKTENSGAALRLHPNGRFLYTSNRGHDSVSVFAIDETGRLTFITAQTLSGSWPRDISFDTTGEFLFVANQHTDTLETYKVDGEGGLEPVGKPFDIPAPLCVLPLS